MKLIFVRIDKANFFLLPGLSGSCSDQRMLDILKRWLVWEYLSPSTPEESFDERIAKAKRDEDTAHKIVRFAKKNPEYTFWEIFNFGGGKFSYAAKKEIFFEEKKNGFTLEEVIKEMKKRSQL